MRKSIINTDYKEEPLELESFINKIRMLKSLAESNQMNTIIIIIKTKISGRALEAIKPNENTV